MVRGTLAGPLVNLAAFLVALADLPRPMRGAGVIHGLCGVANLIPSRSAGVPSDGEQLRAAWRAFLRRGPRRP